MPITPPAPRFLASLSALLAATFFAGCSTPRQTVMVSVAEQRLLLLDEKKEPVAIYPISTSKFGLGDTPGATARPSGNSRSPPSSANAYPRAGS